jgi:hypothetical protein
LFNTRPPPASAASLTSGEELTRWTIRLAIAAYVARLVVELTLPNGPRRESAARWLWTLGCAALWIHVACVFQFYHDWSHAAAYEQTARDTAEVTGFDWGGGVYVNYLTMLAWGADVGWWWLSPESFRTRPRILEALWQTFLAFIMFNATVVFKTGMTRWIGVAATVALLALWCRPRRP